MIGVTTKKKLAVKPMAITSSKGGDDAGALFRAICGSSSSNSETTPVLIHRSAAAG